MTFRFYLWERLTIIAKFAKIEDAEFLRDAYIFAEKKKDEDLTISEETNEGD